MAIVRPMIRAGSDRPATGVVVQRVGYGTLAIAVLVGIFVADAWIADRSDGMHGTVGALLRQGSVLPVFFIVTLSLGSIELRRMLGTAGFFPCASLAHLMIIALVLTPWLAAAGLLTATVDEVFRWQAIWLLLTIVGTAVALVLRGRPDGAIRDISATLMIVAYLGFLGSFGMQIRCSTFLTAQDGVWLLLVIVLITKAADIGGFLVGSALGRSKLLPSISPGKTVEGTFGALLASGVAATLVVAAPSIVSALGFGPSAGNACMRLARIIGLSLGPESDSSVAKAFFFGVVLAVSGQCGDLIESCFKRDVGSKDSGRIIPRFGGILDLIDSPLLAVPVAWLLLAVVWEIV